MLTKIHCNKLVEPTLNFHSGLNSIVGANDGYNSIGKSSVLMLIDFAFGGEDFPKKCDDVIRHVGEIEIEIEFTFDKIYCFKRNTSTPETVFSVEKNEYITLKQYLSFLQKMYNLQEYDLSLRESVGAFFRIYQRKNYDEKEPLHNFPKEKWLVIRKRLLSFFQKYSLIENIELQIKEKETKSKDIDGAYKSGAIKKINKTILKANKKTIDELTCNLEVIQSTLEKNFTNIQEIINDKNLELFQTKQNLQKRKAEVSILLSRSKQNLNYLPTKTQKNFSALIELFPNINQAKLVEVNTFHHGINKLMKEKIQEEHFILNSEINSLDRELKLIEEKMECLKENTQASAILHEFTEKKEILDNLLKQNDFFKNQSEIKEEIKSLKKQLDTDINSSLREIENIINNQMSQFISHIYSVNSISPKLEFTATNYLFHSGDDKGTGKEFANMISLDLSFLKQTCLPSLIHDSLLLKNISKDAVQNIVKLYTEAKKQIFISIDEMPKYDLVTNNIIDKTKVLTLDEARPAFKITWNK